MPDRVELAFHRAAAALLPSGARVLVAVSGGGDSVALLHLFARSRFGHAGQLHVAHLDHGLRRGSAADRRFVERLCRRLDLPCLAERREVAQLRRRDESPAEAARRVRREFLLQSAVRADCEHIATGHTLDDQAETVLLRLARGAGPTALGGIAPAGPGPFVRPLLGLERAELRAWLAARDLAFREDPSNRGLGAERNRVRHLVVPALAAAANPRAARHLAQAAERLRQDGLLLDELAQSALDGLARPRRGGGLALDAAALLALPGALAGRVARQALSRAGVDPRRIASRHVEALLDLSRAGRGRHFDLPGGLRASRTAGRVLVAAAR